MRRKVLAWLLTLSMVFTMMPYSAFATDAVDGGSGTPATVAETAPVAEDNTTDGIKYNVVNGAAQVTDGKSASGDVVIPEKVTIDGAEYEVTSIADSAFNDANEVTSIEVPNTVTSLGGAAFANMDKLKSIKIGNGVTSWGSKLAVNNYELETVVIAEGATLIGDLAFRTCPKLANVTLPSTLKTIGGTAFAYSAIEELTIPASVESIGGDAFKDIDTLKKVTFLGENTKLGSTAFQMCDGLEEVVLPAKLEVIPQGAFRYCTALKTIEFPETLTEIGNYSFQGCTSLESVTISKDIKNLVTNAFNGCTSLKDLTIEEGFAGEVGPYVFQGCTALETVVIPSSMETVGESMFNGCSSLKNVTLSEGVKTLNISAFKNCTSLETLTLPDSLERMRHGSIANCTALKELIVLGDNLPVIEHSSALDDLTDELVVVYSGEDTFTGNWSALADNVAYIDAEDVVRVGKTGYATLEEAVAAAQAGDTILFLTDITEDVTVSKAVTIDGAGKTYTGKITLKADTTIENVNFDGKGYNGYAIETRGANYLTVEDCTAKNYGYGFIQLASGTDLTTVKNVAVSDMAYGVKVDYSNAVVLDNVDINATVAGVLNSNYGEKTITIKDSDINIYGTWTRNNITKTNIVFEGENTVDEFVADTAIDTFKLAAGATLEAPADVVTVTTDVEGYKTEYKDGKYVVVEKEYAAQIGDNKYETFADAVAAANAVEGGATIVLTNDVVLGEKLTITGDVTISGGVNANAKSAEKEYTITRADNYTGTLFIVNAGATLTFDDGVVVDGGNNWTFNKEQYEADLVNGTSVQTGFNNYVTSEDGDPIATAAMFNVQGKVVLNNATIQNHMGNANQRLFYLNGTSSLFLNNGATIKHCATAGKATVAYLDSANSKLTIAKGAKITDNYGSQHAALIRCEKGTFDMTGGEISGNYGAASNGSVLVMRSGSAFNMSGGTISNNSSVIGNGGGNTPCIMLYNGAIMNMTGGEISNNTGYVTGGILAQNGVELTISGGKVVNNVSLGADYQDYNDIYGSDTTSISGGTFTQDVRDWLAEGYMLVDNGDGTYGVKQEPTVLVNGTDEYASIYEALNNIPNREETTIKLLKNITITDDQRMYNDYSIVLNAKYITLDLAGKTLTFDYENHTGKNVLASIALYNGATLTVTDTSDKAGTIYSKSPIQGEDGPRIIWVTSAGSATIEKGNFISEQGNTMFYTSNSNKDVPTTLYIKGGYFEHVNPTTDNGGYDYFNQQDGYQKQIIEISGGTFAKADPRKGFQNDWEITVPKDLAFDVNEDGEWVIVDSVANLVVADGTRSHHWGYSTLEEAIAAAVASEEDDVVQLSTDITLDKTVVIEADQKVTLDLNGKTITGTDNNTSGNFYLINVNKGDLTITDSAEGGKITLKANNEREWNSSSVVVANNMGTLTVKGGTIEHLGGTSMAYGIDNLTNTGEVPATTNIEGGKVESTYFAVRQFANSAVGMNTVNISGGEVGYVWMQSPNAKVNTVATNITGGHVEGLCITGKNAAYDLSAKADALGEGGVYGTMPAGKALTKVNGVYTLATPIAQIDDVAYVTMEEAIAAATAGQTITMLTDVELENTVTIPADKTITLDLNGKTISQTKECTASYEMINNKGHLTIIDSSSSSTGKISFTDTGAGDASAGWGSYTIYNTGTLVVESGTIENLSAQNVVGQSFAHTALAIFQYSGSTTINDGKISTPNYRSVRLWKGDMTINGGTFEGQVWVQCVDDTAIMTITGGTFAPRFNDGSSVFVNNSGYKSELSVTGGTFTTKIGANDVDALNGPITGGTFTETAKNGTNEDLIADGYTFAANGDGTYGVKTLVAKVGERSYLTVQEAIANVTTENSTVTILADHNVSESINVDQDITIDFNGHTVSAAEDFADASVFRVTADAVFVDNSAEQNGGVNGAAGDVYAVIVGKVLNNAALTIEGGKYHGSTTAVSVTKGTLTIKDGEFSATEYNGAYDYVLNCIDANYKLGAAKIIVTGGTFYEFNPQNNAAEGAATSFVPAEYAATGDGVWTVAPAVATIGETGYATLKDAVEAAETDAVITLIKDFELNEMVVVKAGKDITIDLNGKTITGTDNTTKNFSIIDNRGTLTINDSVGDGAITLTATVNSGWNRYSAVIANNPGGKLTVNAGTIEHLGGTDMAYGIDNLTNGKGTYAETVINGGTVKSPYRAIRQFLNGVEAQNILTINGGTIEGANKSVWMQDPSVNANTGTLTVAPEAELKGDVYLFVTAGSTEWPVEVSIAADALADDSEVVTGNVPAGYDVVKTNGVYGVVETFEATIDGVKYPTLADAFAAAQDGDTVKLLQDVATDESVAVNANITLNLNGMTITGTDNSTGSFGLINVNPGKELTVTGEGKITLTSTNNRGWGGYSSVISNQRGKLTIESGTIEHLGGTDMAYGIDNLTNGKGTYAETVINGGTVKSPYRAIRQFLNGVEAQNILTINGGTIEGANKSVWMQDPSVNANTGTLTVGENATLKGDVYLFVTEGSTEWPVAVSIASGALDGESTVVTGNVPNGYEVTEKNGAWTVGKIVAKINGTGYATLEAAFTAAQDGDEVEIVVAGTYAMSASGKDIIITGVVDGVVFDNIGARNLGGANVTFNNVTFEYAENSTYKGLQHAGNLVYNDCTFEGQVFLYGESETFNNCTFNTTDKENYNVWTYGAKNVEFNECTFNSAGKSVLIYKEGNDKTFVANVKVNGCEFNASEPVEGKAAIEMDSSLIAGINLTIDNTTVEGFGTGNVSGNSLWNNKKWDETDANNDITVIVNGETVLAPLDHVAQIGETKYFTLAKAIAAATAGDTITLLDNVNENVTINKRVTIDGADKTYTGQMKLTNRADITIKNVNFDGKGYNGYAVQTAGAYYLTVENCTAKNYGYGFIQVASGTVLTTVKDVTISDMNYGVKVDYSNAVVLENVTTDVAVAGVLNSNYGEKTITIKNSDINILGTWVRNNTIKTTYVFEGENTVNEFVIDAAIDNFKLADAISTLTAPNDVTVTTDVADSEVEYADGKYTVVDLVRVAQIGETQYKTLAEAIAAAQSGETITLLAEVTEDVTINKNLTIDGAKFTYTGKMTLNKVNATIMDVNFVKGAIYKHKSTGVGGKFTIKNCTFDGQGLNDYAINLGGTSTITIESCNAKDYGYGFLQVPSSNTSISVKDVTVDNVNYGFKVDYSGAVTMENVTVTNAHYYGIYDSNHGAKTYTIKNCSFAADGTAVKLWDRNTGKTDTFVFEGVNTATGITSSELIKLELTEGSTLTAPEGLTVTTTVENSEVVYNDGVYSVERIKNYVAQVGEEQFESLQEAIVAAENGDKVILLADINLADVTPVALDNAYNTYFKVEGKTVTVDLNGKVISGEYADAAKWLVGVFSTDNNGHLTLTGNGTVKVTAGEGATVYSLITNYEPVCSVTIENGTYKLDKAYDSLIYSGANAGENEGITVNGGNFELGNVGTGNNGKPWIFNVLGSNDGNVIVNGGTFNADVNHQFWAHEVDVAKELALKANDNGTWTVVPAVACATESNHKIDRQVGYATLQDAIDAVDAGKTVTVLTDIALTETLNVAKGEDVVLDLNGKTIAGTDTSAKNYELINNAGTLTVKDTAGNGKITVTAEKDRGYSNYSAVISNVPGGKLVVESGTIDHLGGTTMAYAIDNRTNGDGTSAVTEIKGGTIDASYIGIRQFLNGADADNKLTISGGTVTGDNSAIFFQSPNGKANTGTIIATENASIKNRIYMTVDDANATVWPVTVSIHEDALQGKKATIVEDSIPVGYKVEKIDNIYTVVSTTNAVAINTNTGEVYSDVTDALDDAAHGETVQMQKDYTEGFARVPANVTLDLNGHKLTATDFLAYGEVKDATDGNGGLVISSDAFVQIQKTNAQLPVYDTNTGCYKFYNYRMVNMGVKAVNTNQAKAGTRLEFNNVEAYDVLAKTTDDSIKIILNIYWSGLPEGKFVEFELKDKTLKDYAAAAYEQVKAGKELTKAMTLSISGINTLETGEIVTCNTKVKSDLGVSSNGLLHPNCNHTPACSDVYTK